MDRVKYKLVVIFFALVVAGGVSVVLSGFNHMIRPAGPVTAFSLKGGGPGVCQVEFLGEKIMVEFPVGAVADFIPWEKIEVGREYMTEVLKKRDWNHDRLIDDVLTILRDVAGKTAAGIESRAFEVRRRISAQDGFHQAE